MYQYFQYLGIFGVSFSKKRWYTDIWYTDITISPNTNQTRFIGSTCSKFSTLRMSSRTNFLLVHPFGGCWMKRIIGDFFNHFWCESRTFSSWVLNIFIIIILVIIGRINGMRTFLNITYGILIVDCWSESKIFYFMDWI